MCHCINVSELLNQDFLVFWSYFSGLAKWISEWGEWWGGGGHGTLKGIVGHHDWPWWQPFDSFCFETLFFAFVSLFSFCYAKNWGEAMAPPCVASPISVIWMFSCLEYFVFSIYQKWLLKTIPLFDNFQICVVFHKLLFQVDVDHQVLLAKMYHWDSWSFQWLV